jgi:acetyl-CoA synthetase
MSRAPENDVLTRAMRGGLCRAQNLAEQVCDGPALRGPGDLAIIDMTGAGRVDVSFAALQERSWQVQAALRARGVMVGDRVGVLLGQDPLCAAAHIAIWRMGAISVPLFKLFRHDALASRLSDSGVQVVVSDEEGAQMLAAFDLRVITALDLQPATPQPSVQTGPDTPAVLIYTSGTTGKPKGALHGHRVLYGHLPGVSISHNHLGQPGDVIWTPADWAWIGGLFDVLMPGLAMGIPVVAARFAKFTPQACADLIAATRARNIFFPPTALRLLKAADQAIPGLRSVASGGEPLGAEMLDWGRRALGVVINEFYGQTECNMVVSSCAADYEALPGAMGKPVPGFDVQIIDEDGNITQGEGDIAVRRGAPSMMLEYWNNPLATSEKYRGDWLITGDRGVREGDFIRFVGREDDVITSGGYRIGPGEIEDCLLTHPAVATVGVVGKPDPLRTEIVKAYVVLKPGKHVLPETLQDWVKAKLSQHNYPREISFVDALPMTVTGKVIRKELRRIAAEEGA